MQKHLICCFSFELFEFSFNNVEVWTAVWTKQTLRGVSLQALGNSEGISHYFLKFYKPNNQLSRR